MNGRRAIGILGCGLWVGGIQASCAPCPTAFQTLAAGTDAAIVERQSPRGARQSGAPGTATVAASVPRYETVSNLTDEELAASDAAIRQVLEKSAVDSYPKVEQLHIAPGPAPDTAIFLAKVRVSGFNSFSYGLIGHYDRKTNTITALENKRNWRTGAELTGWPWTNECMRRADAG